MGVITLNEKDLLAGMASGIKTYEMDKQNKTVTVIFNNGTSTTIQINTSVAKIERVLAAYLTNDTTLVKNDEFNSKVAAYVKDDTTVVKTSEFDSKVNAYLAENEIQGMSDAKNVKLLGADNTGAKDSSTVINPVANESLFFPDGVYAVDYDTLKTLKNNASKLSGTGKLKSTIYKGADSYGGTITDYVEEINTGLIPLDLLNDEIFMSMKTPSDCAGVMNRPYPRHIYSLDRLIGEGKKPTMAHTIFAIYPIPNVELPDTMTFKIGALKLYGYSKKSKRWVILSENVPCQWNVNLHYIESKRSIACTFLH